MGIQVVVDSCVAYKWFYKENEAGLEQAEALLEAHLEGRVVIAAPTTITIELANTLRYARLSEAKMLEIIDLIGAVDMQLFHMTTHRLQHAAKLALRYDMSVYDALFLGLAKELSCPFVTADRKAFEGIDTPVDIRII